MDKVSVGTSQNVSIDYRVAGLGDRIVARIIDGFIQVCYVIIVGLIITSSIDNIERFNQDLFYALLITFIVVPYAFYHLVLEQFMQGQSIGKRAMNIRVVRLDGGRPSFGNYLVRWVFRIIDIWIFSGVVALVAVAASSRGQRLGDMAAGTTVIKENKNVNLSAFHLLEKVEQQNQEQYEPTYPQVSQLTDKQINLIKEALLLHKQTGNDKAVLVANQKFRELLDINPDVTPLIFLRQLVDDYNGIASKL